MKTIRNIRLLIVTALGVYCPQPAWALFGVGDVGFVTITENLSPTDMANWAQQATDMAQQLREAQRMVQHAQTLVAFAGDPRGTIRSFSDLSRITNSMANIVGPGSTADGLREASGFFDDAGRAVYASNDLANAFRGFTHTVKTFGAGTERDVDLYEALFAAEQLSFGARQKIAASQAARAQIAQKIAANQTKYASSDNESERRVIEAELAQLHAQNSMLAEGERSMAVSVQLETEALERNQEVKVLGQIETRTEEGKAIRTAVATQRTANETTTRTFLNANTAEEDTNWGEEIGTPWRAATY